MARLPRVEDQRVQRVCYPGARWLHAFNIVKNKTPTTDMVTKVVLSFGINDRSYDSTELVGNWIRKTLTAAEATFPNAQIYIPVINYHGFLPKRQIAKLKQINTHIINTKKMLDPLPSQLFHTGSDLTHWTCGTGWAMWRHWLKHLN